MAFRTFSTPSADYVLLLENHVRATNDAAIAARLADLDAVVLEHVELGGTFFDEARWAMFRLVNSLGGRRRAPEAVQAQDPGHTSAAPHPGGPSTPPAAGRAEPSLRGDQLGALADQLEQSARRTRIPACCYIPDVNLTSPGLWGSYGVTAAVALAGAVLVSSSNRIVRGVQLPTTRAWSTGCAS